MTIVSSTETNFNQPADSVGATMQNLQIFRPNLWLPDTAPKNWITKTARVTRNNGADVLLLLRSVDGLDIPCPGCGHIEPGVIGDCLRFTPVRLTVEVWRRITSTSMKELIGDCRSCGCLFRLRCSASIAKTAEALAIEAAEMDEVV